VYLDLEQGTEFVDSEHFTESQTMGTGYQIAVALEVCHDKNILHQDMKPMNGKQVGAKILRDQRIDCRQFY
jgi:serine/threonine protein kinase